MTSDGFLEVPMDIGTPKTGGISDLALISSSPEARDWKPGDPVYPARIHRTARVEAYVTIDAGTLRHTTVGLRSWVMKRVHLGHDVVIGRDCELAPGTVIAGECTVGDRCKFGVNSTVKPCLTIGDDAVIGAGAVVTKDIPPGAIVVGNPARLLRFKDGFDPVDRAMAARA